MSSRASKVYSSQEKNRFTQGGTRNRIYSRKKGFQETNRIDTPDGRFEFTELDGATNPVTDIKIKEIPALSHEDSKSMVKIQKPMSPNPSESSTLLTNYLKSTCTSPDNSTIENNCNSKEFEHILSSLDPCSLRAENMHLKDLLVSQLDLIQQQSETILSREKQMKDLRMENEQLRQRLERMERRVRGDSDPTSPVPPGSKPTAESQREPRSRKRSGVPLDGHSNKRVKKNDENRAETPFTPIPENKIKVEVSEAAPFDDLTDEICQEIDDKFRLREELAVKEDAEVRGQVQDQVETPAGGEDKNTVDRNKANKSRLRKNQRKSVSVSISSGSQEPLMTPYHYFIGCRNDIINNDDKLNECAALQRGVEVPKWREDKDYEKNMYKFKTTPKKSVLNKLQEGTENMEDSVYLKRHEKKEASEKRLKKWDIQRLREKSYCEKLRARYTAAQRKKTEPDSLLPTPEGAERLQMVRDGRVPVTAFGESVPCLPQSYFHLPWLDGKSTPKLTEAPVPRKTRHSLN